jgi:choline-sulfatase
MTGLYSSRTGCFDNATEFAAEEPTFAHFLSAHGYDTVLSGKMHFIGPDQLHGFGTRLTTDVYPSGFDWTPTFVDEERHILQDETWGNAINYTQRHVGTRRWNTYIQYDEETHFRAKQYLGNRAATGESEKPFLLCVSYHHPHDPFLPPPEYYDLYRNEEFNAPIVPGSEAEHTTLDRWLDAGFHRTDVFDVTDPATLQEVRRCYAALVTYIDAKIGELLDLLAETGLAEDTVVLFASDHGDMLGERGMVQKRCFYEWSSRVPLILAFPDGRRAGTTIDAPVSLLDVGPTILDLADEDRHREFDLDGTSLLPLVEGESADRGPVFCESHGEGILWPCFMVRSGVYKYTTIYRRETQLFDVVEDPTELRNRSGDGEIAAIERTLRDLVGETFDPQAILQRLESSLPKRRLIRDAMRAAGTGWDLQPTFDPTRQYIRTS